MYIRIFLGNISKCEVVCLVSGRMEVSWDLEAKALWVHEGENVKWNLRMRCSCTASASSVGASYSQEILICEMMAMASRLHVLDHEDVLLAERLHLSLNLSLSWSLVSDLLQVYSQSSVDYLSMSWTNALLCLVIESKDLAVIVSLSIHS